MEAQIITRNRPERQSVELLLPLHFHVPYYWWAYMLLFHGSFNIR